MTHPELSTAEQLDLLYRVREATFYAYEAGEYPSDMDPDVASYVIPDGGLLNAIGDAITALERLLVQ